MFFFVFTHYLKEINVFKCCEIIQITANSQLFPVQKTGIKAKITIISTILGNYYHRDGIRKRRETSNVPLPALNVFTKNL